MSFLIFFIGGEIVNKIDKKQNFTSKIYSQDIEKVNPFFSKVKIYVLYEGLNRNGSYLSRNAIEKAIPTLYNIPIVGEYLVEEQNFGGHGAKVVKNEQGEYQMVLSTRPYGVVPESANIYWETVNEDDGTQRDYLVVDGAFLWSGRYPELHTIYDEGHYNQSMEIEMTNANYALVEGQEVLEVKDFIFTAFCLLGIDKDSDMFGHVEPAFESSKVIAYSLDKESFSSQFNQMIAELKFTLKEGGTNMEETQAQFVEEAQDELRKRLEDGNPVAETAIDEPETETDTPETDVVEEVQEAITEATEAPTEVVDGEPEPTTPETETPAQDGTEAPTEGGTNGGGDAGTFSISEDEFNALKANFEAVNAEVAELREYKRSRELGDLKDKFSMQVSEQEINALFEANTETSIEKLELEIYALIGKKNFSLEGKQSTNKVTVVSPKADKAEYSPYGDIFKNL